MVVAVSVDPDSSSIKEIWLASWQKTDCCNWKDYVPDSLLVFGIVAGDVSLDPDF